MALNFTDEQIKELSGQVLQGPDIIAQADKQIAQVNEQKQDFLELDEQNTVFTDHMINIVDQFHKELKELDGTVKTLYDEVNIDPAARLDPANLHFPQPDWVYFYPKVLDSNTGLPTEVTLDQIEPEAIDINQDRVDLLLNGFTDGAISAASDGVVTGGNIPYDSDPGFSIGDRIVLLAGGGVTGASYGVVTGTTVIPPPTPPPILPGGFVVQYDVEFSSGTLPTGTSVSNFHSGFTNIQRENPTVNLYQIFRQDEVDSKTLDWKNIVTVIQGILDANDSTEDKTELDAERDGVANTLDIIDTWQGQPIIGVGTGRYGDTQIDLLIDEMLARETRIPTRITEINDSLGVLTQDLGDQAKFSGSGRYHDYFRDLNARIHANDGTLRNYYGTETLIQFTEQTKDNVVAEIGRTSDVLQIKLLREDPDGTNTVSMENVSDLVVGQEVKFMDNQKPVLNYTISSIISEERKLILDGALPTNYKITQQARIVRVL